MSEEQSTSRVSALSMITPYKLMRIINRIRAGKTDDECWPWKVYNPKMNAYGNYRFMVKGEFFTTTPSRASFAVHNPGTIVDGLVVMHSCDNPPCVNPRHLSAATQAENMKDASNKGRVKVKRGCLPVLTIVAARELHAAGTPTREIARTLGISHMGARKIVGNRVRADIQPDPTR